MLNKNRKGVSEVVANVLIVLLVIVGIAVIWSVVKPTVDKGAQGIKTGSECLSLSLEAVSCTYTGTAATVIVKRNPGAGNFENLELVFSDGTNSGSVSASPVVTQAGITELSTKPLSVAIPTSVTGASKTVNVAARSGGQLCPPLSEPIKCTVASGSS